MQSKLLAELRKTSMGALALGLAVTHAAPAAAQSETPPAAATSDGFSATDIIVTAQRRAERLEDVPISITALSGEALQKANVTTFRDIETMSPGTRISSTGVFVQPSIRGITSSALGPGIENNIAIYIDGFYQPESAALGSDFANVSGVQILKGPQGTLYGRNALGGAILVTTREPNADRPIIDVEGSYGSRDDVRLRAYLATPLGSGLSFGVGAYRRTNDGYIRNTDGTNAAEYKATEVRAKLKAELGNLEATLGYNLVKRSNPTALAYNIHANLFLGGLPLPAIGPGRTVTRDEYSGNFNPIFKISQNEGTLRLVWDTGFGKLSSYTSYSDLKPEFDSDYDTTTFEFLSIQSYFGRKSFIESLDFTAQPSPDLTVTVGGFYYDDKGTSLTTVRVRGTAGAPNYTQQDSKAYAVYGDATWEVVDNLFLNAGLRYSWEKKTITKPGLGINNLGAKFDGLTPKATLRYELSPGSNVYASYSQGFKAGAFNSIGATVASITTPVRPEKVTAYEVGFKTVQGPLRFDAAAYYYDYTDLQVSALVSVNTPQGPTTSTFLANAATAEIYGAEFNVIASPVEALNIRFGVAYTHARYDDYSNAPGTIVCNPPAGPRNSSAYIVGCPVPAQTVGSPLRLDFSGQRIGRAPDWTASLAVDYTIPVSSGEMVLAANAAYSSAYAPTIETINPVTGEPRFYQSGYIIGSASVAWKSESGISVGAFVENIANKRFKIVSTANDQGDYRLYNEPRRFGIRIGYTY